MKSKIITFNIKKKKTKVCKVVVPETLVIKSCLQWLHANGVMAWRNNTGAYVTDKGGFLRYGFPGSSDIIGVTKRGRALFVECKNSAGGELSTLQMAFGCRVIQTGGVYLVASSSDDLEMSKRDILS